MIDIQMIHFDEWHAILSSLAGKNVKIISFVASVNDSDWKHFTLKYSTCETEGKYYCTTSNVAFLCAESTPFLHSILEDRMSIECKCFPYESGEFHNIYQDCLLAFIGLASDMPSLGLIGIDFPEEGNTSIFMETSIGFIAQVGVLPEVAAKGFVAILNQHYGKPLYTIGSPRVLERWCVLQSKSHVESLRALRVVASGLDYDSAILFACYESRKSSQSFFVAKVADETAKDAIHVQNGIIERRVRNKK